MATNTTIQGFAPQIEPMAEEAYGEAQNIFQQRMGEGYTAPKTPLFTPFSQPELDAQQRTLEIARGPGAGQAIQDASGYARQGVSGVGSLIPDLMNPYTTQVADVAKRRFAEDYKRQVMNPLATAATLSGTRGTRPAIERQLAQERMAQGMSDIDIQMLNAAYNNAAGLADQQRQRELQGAPLIGNLGLSAYQNELRSPELMSAVGEAQRGQLDLARQAQLAEEMAELGYPESTLQQYLNFLGLGRAPTSETKTGPDGAGVLPGGTSPRGLAGIIKDFGPTIAAIPGAIADAPKVVQGAQDAFKVISSWFAEGGRVSGGLASLPVRRADGGSVGPTGPQYRGAVQNVYGGGIDTMSPEFRSTMVGREYQNLMNAQNMKIPSAMDTNYSPADIAAMARNIQRMPLTKETSLGQLGELFTEYGLSALETKDAAQKRAIGAKAAAVAGARESIDTVLDIEKGGVERDKILSDATVKLVEDAISSRDALTAATQGGAAENVIKQLTESANQSANFAQEAVRQMAERFPGIKLPDILPNFKSVNAAIAGDAENDPGTGVTPKAERTAERKAGLLEGIKNTNTKIDEEKAKLQ